MANIYLKIVGSQVFAYGDEESLQSAEEQYKTGHLYDKVVSDEVWEKNDAVARLVDGKIVLGYPQDFLIERNAEIIRNERYLRLRQCDKISPMRWNAMSEAQRKAWTDYRQALLDVPQRPGFPWDGDPDKVAWPRQPE